MTTPNSREMKKHKAPEKSLTETELEMMNIIWSIGPCSINQMLECLPKSRQLAYTTVSTMVRILEQKNYVISRKEGRGHLYASNVSKEQYQMTSVQSLVQNVFEGTPLVLVKQLLSSNTLTEAEINQIKAIIDARKS